MIYIREADFAVLYEAMKLANHPYDHEGAVRVVALERRSWNILRRIAEDQGFAPVDADVHRPECGNVP